MPLQLVRGDISSNLGASLANALFFDLKAMGLLIPSININDIIIDKCKVDRAKRILSRLSLLTTLMPT